MLFIVCSLYFIILSQIVMEGGKEKEQELLKSKPLKEIFPDLALRQKFTAQKLEGKGENQVLVRCEPHPKHCRIPHACHLTLIAPAFY